MRGATPPIVTVSWWSIFQPTRPLRGATSYYLSTNLIIVISTHAPLAGRDEIKQLGYKPRRTFQPTRPLRGATRATEALRMCELYFNPRAPCGARLAGQHLVGRTAVFQPTRPLRGATIVPIIEIPQDLKFQPTRPLRGATNGGRAKSASARFQPTRPLRGATQRRDNCLFAVAISTHAPLAGRDLWQCPRSRRPVPYFNPRAPCGARQDTAPRAGATGRISTHAPLAGRDVAGFLKLVMQMISTHAPLAGRDGNVGRSAGDQADFNPRAPCGARLSSDLR